MKTQVIRESENTVKIVGEGKLYSMESAGVIVVSPLRPKSCTVTFWTEEEYAKAVKQAMLKAEREAKKQCPKHLGVAEGVECGKAKMTQEPGEAKDGVECEECPYVDPSSFHKEKSSEA